MLTPENKRWWSLLVPVLAIGLTSCAKDQATPTPQALPTSGNEPIIYPTEITTEITSSPFDGVSPPILRPSVPAVPHATEAPPANETANDLSSTQLNVIYFPFEDSVYEITPANGKVTIEAGLRVDKASIFYYGFRPPGEIPGGDSTLGWNGKEAIVEFGTRLLRPGDKVVYLDLIDPSDKLLPGETQHGQGYVGIGNGVCNTATVLGLSLGTEVRLPGGEYVPLFIAKPGSIQPHDPNKKSEFSRAYYKTIYNSTGVAVNLTQTQYGLEFTVNPNLPPEMSAELSLSWIDTQPNDPHQGEYIPTVSIDVAGLPEGAEVRYRKLTASQETRDEIVARVTGLKPASRESVYFDPAGNPILKDSPIVPPIPATFGPDQVIKVGPDTSPTELTFRSYLSASQVPEGQWSKTLFPKGFARPATTIGPESYIWSKPDDWLPIDPTNLPTPMSQVNAEELLRILRWNNVDDERNIRYKATNSLTNCNIAAVDWAAAYRLPDYPHSAPLPRWLNEAKLSTNDLYGFLSSPEAQALGWQQIDARSAQDYANRGYLTFAAAKNFKHNPGHIVAVAPGEGRMQDGQLYPNVADGGKNWGPDVGKTVLDSFSHTLYRPELYTPPAYFVWIPPNLN